MNIIPNNCKLVNIVWIERGIILSLISYIIDNYIKLLEKTIIIDNKNYRHFLSIIFNRLKFKEFTKHKSHYFYFNVRKIIKDQDIIIDYLNNNEFVYADKINLVPWYDMNDPLIIYERKDDKLSLTKYKIFILIKQILWKIID